ncbi:MAG: hypothetical protein A3I65_00150 [Betaproteobacteria bacterium RIFCSPLOWO2_02_FULL_68_150]|nr:MAG: hypothetical protein A3I65_00150 [Betaproteobacteria bacterium RIFCSPLOWO2_02_FULL_68_150]
MTYSIVAQCRKTGQYGVSVATYSPNVGARCPLVVPRMGAASVQAVANPQLIHVAARLVAAGLAAEKIVAEILSSDPYPESRQVAVVDVYGRAYAATGARNASWAGHHVGAGYACAGNVLAGAHVVTAMATAFEASESEVLAERLVRAVEAGRDAGGQPEGQNSAALLVSGEHSFPIVDLRVELHDAPEAELRRLWNWYAPMVPYYLQRAYTPEVPRWWQWRMEHVPGWTARHLLKKA